MKNIKKLSVLVLSLMLTFGGPLTSYANSNCNHSFGGSYSTSPPKITRTTHQSPSGTCTITTTTSYKHPLCKLCGFKMGTQTSTTVSHSIPH